MNNKITEYITVVLVFVLGFLLGFLASEYLKTQNIFYPRRAKVDKSLEIYSIDYLSSNEIPIGEIVFLDVLGENNNYVSFLFEFTHYPDLDINNPKITTGQINIPKENILGKVTMIRGYIDSSIYQTGDGTRNAAVKYAESGFITIAPDYLGYAESDLNSPDILESRFQTYTTTLSLLKTLESLPSNQNLINTDPTIEADMVVLSNKLYENVPQFIWAHSNGGQIALTTLAISKHGYPTTLWAPVSKPFPYSILFYTDTSDDGGKLIRGEIAKFENSYDLNKYSFTNYLENINAPILIQQGTADKLVPSSWSREIYSDLKDKDVDVFLETYPGGDHNLQPFWSDVVEKDIEYFKSFLSI